MNHMIRAKLFTQDNLNITNNIPLKDTKPMTKMKEKVSCFSVCVIIHVDLGRNQERG